MLLLFSGLHPFFNIQKQCTMFRKMDLISSSGGNTYSVCSYDQRLGLSPSIEPKRKGIFTGGLEHSQNPKRSCLVL